MARSKWLMLIVAVCVLAAVAAITYAAGKTSAPEVIRAQRFELVDTDGTVLAALRLRPRGQTGGAEGASVKRPVLEMYDESDRTRVQLFIGHRGPGLDLLHSERGKRGIALVVSEWPDGGHGKANLVLTSAEDGTRAGIHVSSDGGARLELRDETGKTIWSRP